MTKENIPDDWMVRKLISDKANTILASVFGQGEDKKYGNYVNIPYFSEINLG